MATTLPMKVFQAMVEYQTCTAGCAEWKVQRGECPHPKVAKLIPEGAPNSKRSGPQQRCTMNVNRGRFAMVYEADVVWRPTLSDDEQAALRMGGQKALLAVQAAKAKDTRPPRRRKGEA